MSKRLSISLVWLAAFALVSGVAAAPALAPQSSSASGVSVAVTPRVVSGEVWEFEITINTHSQNLSEELTKAAVLVAAGGTSYSPTDWQGDPPGGHHRRGILRFKAPEPVPAAIELRIQRPGERAPRTFQWKLR